MREKIDQWTEQRGGRDVPGTGLVRKVFELLDIIGAAPGLVTIPEMVARTGWPRSTLYRILQSITAHGFARFDPVGQGFTLGFRFIELAQNVWTSPDLATVAAAELRRLRDLTGETAYLAVLHDTSMVGLGKFESGHSHRSAATLGIEKPIHCTSQGKAFLAFLPDGEAAAILARSPMRRFTEQTITDRALLRGQLPIIRSRGFAVDDQEIMNGIRCVGAPILDAAGQPIASISVAGPIYRITSDRVEQLGPEVADAANAIRLRLSGMSRGAVAKGGGPSAHPGHREPAFHGAAPIWDAGLNAVHWVDLLAPSVQLTGRTTVEFRPPAHRPIDAMMPAEGGPVVFMGGQVLQIADARCVGESNHRDLVGLTDIRVDPKGIPWAALWRETDAVSVIGPVSPDGTVDGRWTTPTRVDALAWDPDGDLLYAAEAGRGIFQLSVSTGTRRLFCKISKASGSPRGLVVDSEKRLWVALYDGWSVARLTAEGDFDRVIALPVPRPTGLTFGGDDLCQLFITTARIGLAREVLENAPLSGRLLMVAAGVTGYATRCAAYSLRGA
ncbi:MAG TPA: IclR family transcriptional regulator C-terminal domain-containing protein [Stellaceae bacterium]|nr:IclR family transcriptional regulator C-terminal domain-containing protein [Stellaceae bacterium]